MRSFKRKWKLRGSTSACCASPARSLQAQVNSDSFPLLTPTCVTCEAATRGLIPSPAPSGQPPVLFSDYVAARGAGISFFDQVRFLVIGASPRMGPTRALSSACLSLMP